MIKLQNYRLLEYVVKLQNTVTEFITLRKIRSVAWNDRGNDYLTIL